MLVVFIAVAAAGVGLLWPRWRTVRDEQRRRRLVDDALPEVADLLLVVLGAGAGVDESLGWVVDRGPEAVRAGFAEVLARCDGGHTLAASLPTLVDELSPQYWAVVTALTAAVRDGAPTSSLLLRLGDEARAARRQANERAARSLPIKMLFPLVCCSLPAVVVGAVLPLVLVAFGRL